MDGSGGTSSNGGLAVGQLGPMTAPITRSAQFRFATANNNNNSNSNGLQSEQTSSSSFSTTPALTPLTGNSSNTQQVFFANSNDVTGTTVTPITNTPTGTTVTTTTSNTLVKPKKSSLARSFSARYHNEHSLPVYGPQLSAPTNNQEQQASTSSTPTVGKSKSKVKNADIPAVICNRYASLSDDCIDAVNRARELTAAKSTQPQSQTSQPVNAQIQLRYPPRRTPSQVRFMAPPLAATAGGLPPPDLNVSSPSPDNSQLNVQPSVHSPPPPFPYPNGDVLDGSASSVPPPPFHPNYYQLTGEDNNHLYSDPAMVIQQHQQTAVPPYNFHDTAMLMNHSRMMLVNNSNSANKEDFDSDPDSDSDDDDISEKNIPITVCLTLVVGYICGGAWFFSNSEDWTFLDASYFCFVTLSKGFFCFNC